jgi:hypothetical protein
VWIHLVSLTEWYPKLERCQSLLAFFVTVMSTAVIIFYVVIINMTMVIAGCKDIDDALCCKALPNGNFEVGVRILS